MTALRHYVAQLRHEDVRSYDPDYGTPTSHPLDPRNDDEDPTSLQTVGELPVTVTYRIGDTGRVSLQEVTIEGPDKTYALDSDDFAEHIKAQWRARIQREVKDALEDVHRGAQARRFA